MALVIERETISAAPEDVAVPRTSPPRPAAVKPLPSFGRCFLLGTALSVFAIMVTTVVVWSIFRGEFWPALGLATFLGFWFGPAAGLIGGGTYWTTKHPLH